jgi:hypothetical protein
VILAIEVLARFCNLKRMRRRDRRIKGYFMRVAMIGTGYVGLVSGAYFGHQSNLQRDRADR